MVIGTWWVIQSVAGIDQTTICSNVIVTVSNCGADLGQTVVFSNVIGFGNPRSCRLRLNHNMFKCNCTS